MSRIAFTLRIGPEEKAALENLSKVEGRPINQLLNEAIKIYLNRRGPKERNLEASIAKLRAYRKRDPQFKKAIAAFIEAEASLEDPIEGEVIISTSKPAGPVQRKVRDLLGA